MLSESQKHLASKILFLSLLGLIFLTWPFYKSTSYWERFDIPMVWMFNSYKDFGIQFGRDIIYNYGPWAFLYEPYALPGKHHLLYSLILFSTLYSSIIWLLFLFAKRTGNYWAPSAIFSLIFIFLNDITLPMMVFALIPIVFYIEDIQRKNSFLFCFPAALAAFMFFVKFNYGISLTIFFMMYLSACFFINHEPVKKIFLKFLFFSGLFVLFARVNFDQWEYFDRFIRISLEITKAYSEDHASAANTKQVWLALASILFFLGTLVYTLIEKKDDFIKSIFFMAIFSASSFFIFKQGFISEDRCHYFFRIYPLIASLLLLVWPKKRIFICVFIVAYLCFLGHSVRSQSINLKVAFSRFDNVKNIFNFKQMEEKMIARNQRIFELTKLAPEEKAIIGDSTLDLIPVSKPSVHGTGMRYKPSPLVFFHNGSIALDGMMADYLKSKDAAEFIIFFWVGFNNMHPLLISPKAATAMILNYESVDTPRSGALLRKKNFQAYEEKFHSSQIAKVDTEVSIPKSNNLIIAKVHPRRTFIGHVMRILFRTSICVISLRKNGDKNSYRSIIRAANLPGGFIANYLPMSNKDIHELIRSGIDTSGKIPFDKVKFRFAKPFFEKEYEIEFYEIRQKTGLS